MLVEQIPAITFIEAADPTGPLGYRTVYASPQVESILGYSPAEWIADPELWEKLLVEEDRERAVAENAAATLERRPFHARYRLRARDGRTVWMREDSDPPPADRREGIAWHGVLFDVTEEEGSREALRRSAERLATLHAIDVAILSGHTPDRLAADTAATIRRMVSADRVLRGDRRGKDRGPLRRRVPGRPSRPRGGCGRAHRGPPPDLLGTRAHLHPRRLHDARPAGVAPCSAGPGDPLGAERPAHGRRSRDRRAERLVDTGGRVLGGRHRGDPRGIQPARDRPRAGGAPREIGRA